MSPYSFSSYDGYGKLLGNRWIKSEEPKMKVAGIIEDRYENTLNLCIRINENSIGSSHSRYKWEIIEDNDNDSYNPHPRIDYGYAPSYDTAVFVATRKIRKLLKKEQPRKSFKLFRS